MEVSQEGDELRRTRWPIGTPWSLVLRTLIFLVPLALLIADGLGLIELSGKMRAVAEGPIALLVVLLVLRMLGIPLRRPDKS